MDLNQLNLFGAAVPSAPVIVEQPGDSEEATVKEAALPTSAERPPAVPDGAVKSKRGRKSNKQSYPAADEINIPPDDILEQKLYYPISEVAGWFGVASSQIRFWEKEFDILQPRKNRKGDRLFRPEDVKNLRLIYHLLRNRKFSIQGAKDYLASNKNKTEMQVQLTQSLTRLRSFLLELKTNLED